MLIMMITILIVNSAMVKVSAVLKRYIIYKCVL